MTGKVVGRKRISLYKLSLSPNNVRKELNPLALEQLVTSVKESKEILTPIIVNTNNEIVAGQRRYLAAKKAGFKDIECIIKEYSSPSEEIIDSLVENHLHRDISAREKGEAVIELHDTYNLTFEEISRVLGISLDAVYLWYKKSKGPEALSEDQVEEKIKEIREEKSGTVQKKKSKKEKRKKGQKTITQIHEETEEEKKIREAYERARELYNTFGLRTCKVLAQIIDHPLFRDDIYKCLKLLEYAREFLPLRELENIAKNIKQGIPADLEYLKELYTNKHEYILRSLRFRKDQIKRAKPILKRRNISFHHMVEDAIEDWIRKWESPEEWYNLKDIKPKIFDKK
jgi:ParB/RepB/Spo0J family partition protein